MSTIKAKTRDKGLTFLLSSGHSKNTCIRVEKHIFEYINEYSETKPQFVPHREELYLTKIQQVLNQIDKSKEYVQFNAERILASEQILEIANLPLKTLAPDKWILLQPDLEILDEEVNNTPNIATSTAFTCGVCGNNQCVYSEVQVRSCDENATIFVRCVHCGNCFRG